MKLIFVIVAMLLIAGCGVGRPGPSDPCERMDYMAYEHQGTWPGGIKGFDKDFREAFEDCREQRGY